MLYDYKIFGWTFRKAYYEKIVKGGHIKKIPIGTKSVSHCALIKAETRFDAYNKFNQDKLQKWHCVIWKIDSNGLNRKWSVNPGKVHDKWTVSRVKLGAV